MVVNTTGILISDMTMTLPPPYVFPYPDHYIQAHSIKYQLPRLPATSRPCAGERKQKHGNEQPYRGSRACVVSQRCAHTRLECVAQALWLKVYGVNLWRAVLGSITVACTINRSAAIAHVGYATGHRREAQANKLTTGNVLVN